MNVARENRVALKTLRLARSQASWSGAASVCGGWPDRPSLKPQKRVITVDGSHWRLSRAERPALLGIGKSQLFIDAPLLARFGGIKHGQLERIQRRMTYGSEYGEQVPVNGRGSKVR